MKTYVALLRGINVGGQNKLPMGELMVVLQSLGLVNVKTYIQTGNIVFQSEEQNTTDLSGRISAAIGRSHGFVPQVMLLDVAELEAAVSSNPYPEAEDEPKTLQVYFLAGEPRAPYHEKLDALKTSTERFALQGRVFYLHAPNGIGRSKLAAGVDKVLGVATTARNWRTVTRILAMTKE